MFLRLVRAIDFLTSQPQWDRRIVAVVGHSQGGAHPGRRRLGRSRHLLITAVARAENTPQAFCGAKSSVPQRGRPPVLAEPVRCRLGLRVGAPAKVYALDETGKRRLELTASYGRGTLRIDLFDARSPRCEVVVE